MATADDDHLCLRCNTHIKGLEAYIMHRQTGCSQRKEKARDKKGEGTEETGTLDMDVINESPSENPPQGTQGSPGTRQLRERKAAKSQSPSRKKSQEGALNRQAGRGTSENENENVGSASPDSPRRSSRRGIRISYTDLLLGCDRNEAKIQNEAVAKITSPAKRKESGRDRKHRPLRDHPATSTDRKGQKRAAERTTKLKNKHKKKNAQQTTESTETEEEIINSTEEDEQNLTVKRSTAKKIVTVKKENLQEESLVVGSDFHETAAPAIKDENFKDEIIYIKSGKFYCHVCEIYCLTKKKIDEHCATRKHAKRFSAASGSNIDFSESKENTDKGELLECHACQYRTRNEGQYERHLRSICHAEKANITLFPCQKCHRKYKTTEELEAHQSYHIIPRCRKCKLTFDSEEALEEHLDLENHRVEYRCQECNKTFTTKGSLQTHMRGHDPNSFHKCDICSAKFVQLGDLNRHKFRHQGYKPFKCSLCDYESLTKYAMERHMRVHAKRSRDFKCDECDGTFYDSNLLKQHKYMKHNPERKYPCTYDGCTYAFKYRSCLVTHMRMHTNEKPFLCAECGYATSTKYSLTKHMRLHTGEKPFKCDFPNCTYASRLSTHLSRHKIIHTGTKPYKCSLCNYACNNKQNLRKHILTTKAHAGIHMYKCKKCDNYSSNSFRDYVVHLRKEHGSGEDYINFFDVAEEYRKHNDEESMIEGTVEEFVPREKDENVNEGLESFSVVTVVPGREGSRQVRNIASILADGEDVEKLEQVILSLENGEVVQRGAEGSSGLEQLEARVPIQLDSMGNIITVGTKATGEHGETIVIIPEVQAETEIHTSEGAGTVGSGEGGGHIQEYVVEIDHSGRPVTKEDMAAATWLHNMGSMQGVAVETIMPEAGDAAEQIASE